MGTFVHEPYLSTIQHEKTRLPYRFVAYSSQMTSGRLIWGPKKTNPDVKSTSKKVTSNPGCFLFQGLYVGWMNERFAWMR